MLQGEMVYIISRQVFVIGRTFRNRPPTIHMQCNPVLFVNLAYFVGLASDSPVCTSKHPKQYFRLGKASVACAELQVHFLLFPLLGFCLGGSKQFDILVVRSNIASKCKTDARTLSQHLI